MITTFHVKLFEREINMSEVNNCDVLIIGKGPAGISASLYAVRAGMNVIVIGKDTGALGKAHQIDNYYGFPEGISGEELAANGIKGAQRLGVRVVDDEVFEISAEADGSFLVTAGSGNFQAPALILAAGTSRQAPPLKGLKEYEGKGVSYCAVCDAFFYRNLPVAVLGSGEYAVSEASHLQAVASSVTILTNGEEMQASVPEGIAVNTGKIREITGKDLLSQVIFEDESVLDTEGVFVAIGTASSVDLARKLGVVDPEGKIAFNDDLSTFVPGFYTAGDCNKGLLQVAKAVYEGAVAGSSAAKYVRNRK